jgi:hypothetical protein
MTSPKKSNPPFNAKAEGELDPSSSPPQRIQSEIAGQRHPQERLELTMGLLNGFTENDRLHFWEDQSPDEKRARRAFGDLLRSGEPLSQSFRVQLARLIHPQGIERGIIKRRIKFEFVQPGTPSPDYRNSKIAKEIYLAVSKHTTVNAAAEEVGAKYGLGERAAKKIWGENRDLLERIFGPLPSLRRRRRTPPKNGKRS